MKKISELSETNILYELEGPIQEAIEYLIRLKTEAESKGYSLRLEKDTEYAYYGNNNPDTVLSVYQERDERPEEKEARMKAEDQQKASVLEYKRQQFELLKKELGE